MNEVISISVMIEGGGYKVVKLPPNFVGVLATAIYEKGSETVELQSGIITVVGFMVTGKKTGDRVIVLGDMEKAEVTT